MANEVCKIMKNTYEKGKHELVGASMGTVHMLPR
jgi:hypothetical protein